MASKDYPNVPSAQKQIITTILILVICTFAFFVTDIDPEFSARTKRFLSRIGGYVVLAGGLLGGFGFLWNKKNKIKLTFAQQDFNAHTVSIAALNAQSNAQGGAFQPSINTLQSELNAAEAAIKSATNFEETVATVGIAALFLLTVGTVLQILAT